MSKPTSPSRILQRVDRGSLEVVRRLHRLQRVGSALSAEQDLGRLLALILRGALDLTHADSGSVFIREDEVLSSADATARDELYRSKPYLLLKVAQNDSMEFPFEEMRLNFDRKSIAGHVAVSGDIANIPDVYRIPGDAPYSYSTAFDQVSGYRCKSMLVLPMRNRDAETIGVIQLINKKKDRESVLATPEEAEKLTTAFDAVDEELVLSLASQAAVCIEKTKLYDEIERMFEGLVTSFTIALEKRNRTTFGHCKRVAQYAVAIAREVDKNPEKFGGARFTEDLIRELRYGGLLHDIGKIAVPEAVLDKRNKLTDPEIQTIEYRFHYWKERLHREHPNEAESKGRQLDEWIGHLRRINIPRGMTDEDLRILKEIRTETFIDVDGSEKPLLSDTEFENLEIPRGNLTKGERKEVEKHIVDTWEILRRIPWPKNMRSVPKIAATHHERSNGTGYPWGLQSHEIPLGGRILALVDVYEALTAKDRPYKPAIPPDRALAIIREEVEAGRIDKNLFDLFVEKEIHLMFRDEVDAITSTRKKEEK